MLTVDSLRKLLAKMTYDAGLLREELDGEVELRDPVLASTYVGLDTMRSAMEKLVAQVRAAKVGGPARASDFPP